MISIEKPPNYPPCIVAGNYEEPKDEIICPLCKFPSGWCYSLWINNIPDIGLYCQNCKDVFYEGDFYND